MNSVVLSSSTQTLEQQVQDAGQRSDILIAVLQRISWGKLFLPQLVEQIFDSVLATDPPFPVLEKLCRTVSPWLYEYGPDEKYGWLDREKFSIKNVHRAYELWRTVSEQLIEGVVDFYSAIEAARHAHTGPRHDALIKVREFAVTPEHLLDWVEFLADVGYGMSENDHRKYVVIITSYRLPLPADPTLTFGPQAVRDLKDRLEHYLLSIYRKM